MLGSALDQILSHILTNLRTATKIRYRKNVAPSYGAQNFDGFFNGAVIGSEQAVQC